MGRLSAPMMRRMWKRCVQAEPRGVESGSNDGNDHDGHEDEEEEDLSLLSENGRIKVLAKKTETKNP
jgi:hypothetical protein